MHNYAMCTPSGRGGGATRGCGGCCADRSPLPLHPRAVGYVTSGSHTCVVGAPLAAPYALKDDNTLTQGSTKRQRTGFGAAHGSCLQSLLGEDASDEPLPDCSVCFTRVTSTDAHHFIDMAGVCPLTPPCKLCATCARSCLDQCAATLNARSQEAEVLLSIGAPGRAAVCLACRHTATSRSSPAAMAVTMGRLETLVLGDSTCACADCAHARGGPEEAALVLASQDTGEDSCSMGSARRGGGARGDDDGDDSDNSGGAGGAGARGTVFVSGPGSALDDRASHLSTLSIVVPRRVDRLFIDNADSPQVEGMVAAAAASAAAAGQAGAAAGATGSSLPAAPPAMSRLTSVTVAPTQDNSPRPKLVKSFSSSSLCSGCGETVSVLSPAHGARALRRRRWRRPSAKTYLGAPVFAQKLWRKVLEHRATLQLAYRCPFGVFKRCPVPGCDSREYVVFDERSQFMRFAACNHEVCRNCEKLVAHHGPSARRNHNRQCMVTLGSQLVRKQKNWSSWRAEAAYEAAVRAMHEYLCEVISRRQRLECPRCGVIVAKTGSCNHIVCECGEHLCQCCHRRLADMLPHPIVKAANAHAVAPYGTYVAVDEVAMVQNHYEVGGWKRQEPQKRLCPRLFSEVAAWFPSVLDGRAPAAGQTTPVGLQDGAGHSDQIELNMHSQAVRLRILALILNRRVVTKSALQAVAEYDRERNHSMLMDMWPTYPLLAVHELMYIMWEWGRVDRLSNTLRGGARRHASPNTWVYVPTNTAFHYDARGTYKTVNVLEMDVFSDPGSEQAVLNIPSLLVQASPVPAATGAAAATAAAAAAPRAGAGAGAGAVGVDGESAGSPDAKDDGAPL